MEKPSEALLSENGFTIMMKSGATLVVRANKYMVSGTEEIRFLTDDGRVVGRFRYSDIAGIVNVDYS